MPYISKDELPYLWHEYKTSLMPQFDDSRFAVYVSKYEDYYGAFQAQDDFGNIFYFRFFNPWFVHWEWVSHLSSGSSMYKKGTFPPGMTKDELEKEIHGTFGGKFESFDPKKCTFAYRAYTD